MVVGSLTKREEPSPKQSSGICIPKQSLGTREQACGL